MIPGRTRSPLRSLEHDTAPPGNMGGHLGSTATSGDSVSSTRSVASHARRSAVMRRLAVLFPSGSAPRRLHTLLGRSSPFETAAEEGGGYERRGTPGDQGQGSRPRDGRHHPSGMLSQSTRGCTYPTGRPPGMDSSSWRIGQGPYAPTSHGRPMNCVRRLAGQGRPTFAQSTENQ